MISSGNAATRELGSREVMSRCALDGLDGLDSGAWSAEAHDRSTLRDLLISGLVMSSSTTLCTAHTGTLSVSDCHHHHCRSQ